MDNNDAWSPLDPRNLDYVAKNKVLRSLAHSPSSASSVTIGIVPKVVDDLNNIFYATIEDGSTFALMNTPLVLLMALDLLRRVAMLFLNYILAASHDGVSSASNSGRGEFFFVYPSNLYQNVLKKLASSAYWF